MEEEEEEAPMALEAEALVSEDLDQDLEEADTVLEEAPGEDLEEEDTALEEALEEAPALEGQCPDLKGVVLGQGKVAALA